LVARCYLPDDRDLSAEMVKQGLAIDGSKFSGGKYRSLERPDARRKLWLADARETKMAILEVNNTPADAGGIIWRNVIPVTA
jgi:endonuclease YncB( thermonuclease family)